MRTLGTNLMIATGLTLASLAAFAQGQPVALRPGESTDLHAVYWVSNCKSALKKILSVEVLEGPPALLLSVREEMVTAKRQNCADKVPGGIVVLTAGPSLEKGTVTLKYRVNYDTEDGKTQSKHSVQVDLYP